MPGGPPQDNRTAPSTLALGGAALRCPWGLVAALSGGGIPVLARQATALAHALDTSLMVLRLLRTNSVVRVPWVDLVHAPPGHRGPSTVVIPSTLVVGPVH
ncbi:MAG TPA: hypothetical protein VNN74_09865 [Candidatus Micrarchaeia archaeon]|nr:hypothetical protein [Candidatus Micrarchaeia archaeon]